MRKLAMVAGVVMGIPWILGVMGLVLSNRVTSPYLKYCDWVTGIVRGFSR